MLLRFYKTCAFRQVIGLKDCQAKERVNTVSASMTNGEFVLSGNRKMLTMWKSWIITNHFYIYCGMLFV